MVSPRKVRPQTGARKATEALLSRERFQGVVWDAHYHDIGIMQAVSAAGIAVFRTTLDFLAEVPERFYPADMPNVITEPPLDQGDAYARRALQVVTAKVALLLPVSFLTLPTSQQLFAETPLVRVYLLAKKPVHRKAAMAWLVWEKGNVCEEPRLRLL